MFYFDMQDILFQQKNTPIDNVIDWLKRNSIQVVEHPPDSPGLNPIQHA